MIIVLRRQSILFGLSLIILLSGFTAPAQSRRKGAAKPRVSSAHPVAVKEIDLDALKAVLKRDASRPLDPHRAFSCLRPLKAVLQREAARPLLVNFWATWCDPCREEFPDLVKIDAEYRAKELDFITISLDDVAEIKTGVPKFLRGMKAKMPAYLLNMSDPEPAIRFVDPQWSGALPATILYNGEGEVVFKHFGRVNADELRAAIDKEVGSEQ
jgi:thiol-disulfide isomerase/thioredoxin